MISLGIESSAYVFGVGIVKENEILADERFEFKPEKGKGMIPREASYHFSKIAKKVLENALRKAGISIKDIDVISFTQGMGIPNNLKVGAVLARYLSLRYKKPLVGVNHAIAHIEIGKLLTNCKDPVVLYLSGGNTQIIAFAEGKYRIFGETLDIAVGNAFDVLAREMGFGMPGGPHIERLAKSGNYVELPYVVKGMDVSFSGILTACLRLLRKGVKKEDIAFSFQETVFSMLVEATERAVAQLGKNEVLAVGGVASNKRLKEMLEIMCKERGAKAYVVPKKYARDNGVMIAWTGLLAFKSGYKTEIKESFIRPRWRVEEVKVTWLN